MVLSIFFYKDKVMIIRICWSWRIRPSVPDTCIISNNGKRHKRFWYDLPYPCSVSTGHQWGPKSSEGTPLTIVAITWMLVYNPIFVEGSPSSLVLTTVKASVQ